MSTLVTNFWHVTPILGAAAVAVAIIAERYQALFRTYPIGDSNGFFKQVSDLVSTGRIADAVGLCDRFPEKPAARVVRDALLRAHQPENLIESGLTLAVGSAAQSIQKRTAFLSTIANVATLFGLLGTIAGLIHSFAAVGSADPQQKSALLAAGISTAMNATMLGLGLAIPCMIAFSLLMNRTQRLTAEVDEAAVRTMDILRQRFYSVQSGEWAAPKVRRASRANPEVTS